MNWETIPNFTDYEVSDHGVVRRRDSWLEMQQTPVKGGARKVNLTGDDNVRVSRSVSVLVAEAFVPLEESLEKTWSTVTPIHLNGDYNDNRAVNLVWRPRWFAIRYSHQFRRLSHPHYDVPVINASEDIYYETISDAALAEGLLCEDIIRSCGSGWKVFPTGDIYEYAFMRRV